MLLQHAIDEFLLYLEIEKNYSQHTLDGYSYDLKLFKDFLVKHDRSLALNDISKTLMRRFLQEKITKDKMQARTIHRKISCLIMAIIVICKDGSIIVLFHNLNSILYSPLFVVISFFY
ncbi:site-specific integrase [Metabacillus fastidiosus]|uniref:site-specific integrase n=1 Tax=Metabacillus fastidiosus TaxID=1458 RepID=UPI003D29B123